MRSGSSTVGFFCATFLKPEMLHIYRHITGLRSFRPVVIAQKREGDWPVDCLRIVKRSPGRFLARASERQFGFPWQISESEAARIVSVIQAESCVLLHVFFGNVAVHLLPLLRRSPVPVVVSFHGSDVAGSMASEGYSRAREELFALATTVPCRSEQLAAAVARLGCPEGKTRLMRTVLPDVPFSQRKPPNDGGWKIVQAARLVAKKGLSTALRAFARFVRHYPNSTFLIAGEGPLAEELRRLSADLGLGDRVQFLGFLSQDALQHLFAESHIFLQPSENARGDVEGVPNAMLEAMAGGLPVVSTRHGGIPEVIEHGRNGLLCAEKDLEGLTSALLKIAADPFLYRDLAEQASISVREQFSKERQIAAIEEIYNEAIIAHAEGAQVQARTRS
jgi:colanic acid/amylovoran biosynthesis glycosyltransferase